MKYFGRKPVSHTGFKKICTALVVPAAVLALSACGTTVSSVPQLPQQINALHVAAPVLGLQTQTFSYGVAIDNSRNIKTASALGPAITRDGKVWVYQPTAVPGPTVARVTLAPVTTDRKFNARPYNPAYVEVGKSIPDAAPDNLSQWILVSGNYTPKGIYSRPDTTSRILTRVAPGSRLRLEAAVEGWLKVETTSGMGYLKAHDAKRLTASQGAVKKRIITPDTAKL